MGSDDCNCMCDKSEECKVYVNEKEVDEALEDHDIQPYVVFMDENGKIYTRHTFFGFLKMFNWRIVDGNLSKKNVEKNSKKDNTNDSNSILKSIIIFMIGFICALIFLELHQILAYII